MPMFQSFFRRNKESRKKGTINDSPKSASLSNGEKSNRREDHDPCIQNSSSRFNKLRTTKSSKCLEDSNDINNVSRNAQHSFSRSSEAVPGNSWSSRSKSPSNPVSRCPSNIDTRMPLPLPPNHNISGKQPSIQPFIPLPSPRPRHRAINRDSEGTSGYLTDSASSDCSSESGIGNETLTPYRRHSEGEALRSHQSMYSEDPQRILAHIPVHSPARVDVLQPGSPVQTVTSQRLEFRNGQGEGGDLHIHIHVNGVQNSASNSTFSSPVLSPRALGHQEPPWLWNPASNHLQQTSSTTSGHNSGHNSISSDFPLQHRRPSSDLSPMAQSRSMSPRHPMAAGYDSSSWADIHPLPRHPTSGTATASPSTPLSPRSCGVPPRSPGKGELGVLAGKWQKGRLLGSGSFGKVYKGIHSETGEFCAIKEVEFVRDDPKSIESAKQLAQEIMVLSSLRHPNIVHYKGSEMVGGSLYIYLELVSGGSIYKLYQEFKKIEEPVIRRYTRQILQGLHFLHSMGTVHRDIKGANILVDQEGTVKLADFGMAKHIKEQGVPLSIKGSPYWMAPEVIMQKNTGYEFAVDIWSLGCTVLEMFTGKPPWSEYEGVAAMFKVTRADTPIPDFISQEGQSFVRLCLQRNPAQRPSAAVLLEHPFVQIPKDGPDSTVHTINITEFLAQDVGDRGIRQDSSVQRIGHPPSNVRNHSATLRTGIYPSLSAPVSPKSVNQALGGMPLTGSTAGFSTPPTGQSALSTTGFNLYTDFGSQSSVAHRRLVGTRQRTPTSLHVTVNRPDAKWDVISDSRQIPLNNPSRQNNHYVSGNPRSTGDPDKDQSRKNNGPLQKMDEKITKVLLKKSPHQNQRYSGRGSVAGPTSANRIRNQ